ncbi:hypothetical protein [Acidithiobacillus concretivorus]|uniref:Uncharacterized protein n=1 Tax=Acidithiobacillus concretivorus TaxID=3063952 RepID=A0ABS5ZTX2_9PROT|nr:hypothetical protein [Acidithiobacillus concretivorus]MBU2739622.1 hypothetical protein [Acidithiobacillus concretivorus]
MGIISQGLLIRRHRITAGRESGSGGLLVTPADLLTHLALMPQIPPGTMPTCGALTHGGASGEHQYNQTAQE